MLSGVDCLLIRETFFFFRQAHISRVFLPGAIAQGHCYIYVFRIGSYCRAIESFFSASYLSTGLSILPLAGQYLCDGFAVTSFLGNHMRIQDLTFRKSLRQLGTALEWPEAKKNADKVRNWGIEVGLVARKNVDSR